MKRIGKTLAAAGLFAWSVAAQAPASLQLTANSKPAGLQQRVAAIMSRPEFVHARFGMEFWALSDNSPVFRIAGSSSSCRAPPRSC
jgi:hypothetical protein